MVLMKKKKANNVLHLVTLCLVVLVQHLHAIWLNHGGGISNRRNAMGEVLINPITARNLRLRWKFITEYDVSATPAIANGVIYFPSWNGNLYAVNARNGNLVWQQNIGKLTGLSGTGAVTNVNASVSRSTPTVAGNVLIIGIYGPAVVIAVSRSNGQLVWSTQIDPRPLSQITASGTVYRRAFYVGVSSLEELLPANKCCTFRGSMVKLDIGTGTILWQTFTLPENGGRLGGFSGGAIWGSSPSIDIVRQLVIVGTGNLYNAPEEVLKCQASQKNQTKPPTSPNKCIGKDVHFDSILAFDIRSGDIVWAKRLEGYDVFYFTCLVPNNPDCPPGPNLDADFGEAPMLLTIRSNGRLRDVAVAVQKSGFAWALDRNNGDIVWFKKAGPGSLEGGGIWGAATDGRRIYTNIVNGDRKRFNLAPSNQTTNAGAWVALDARDGEILWTTANPSNETSPGPVTFVNGVVFAGSVAPNGPVYAMDARTGSIIWANYTGATVYGGASASYGCVYIGNGYSVGLAKFHPTWTRGNSVSAYCVR